VLGEVRPDLVLVAGAMCHVDGCEQDPRRCRSINTDGPRAVSEWLVEHGGQVVFFSTDHVFDGSQAGAYVETDDPNPLSVYAQSKLDAERAIRAVLPDRHLVIRSGWLYGPDLERRNFALRLVDRVRAGETVPVPSDQWGSPTFTEDLAAATRWLVERGTAGTVHASGPDFLDRVALAHAIGGVFGIDTGLITPLTTDRLNQPARRSLRVRLACDKLRALGAPPFRGISDGLAALARWDAVHGASRHASSRHASSRKGVA
jgi:dTDP-4-dehydrorhamnose reductase